LHGAKITVLGLCLELRAAGFEYQLEFNLTALLEKPDVGYFEPQIRRSILYNLQICG
jgi:hypothetical protein